MITILCNWTRYIDEVGGTENADLITTTSKNYTFDNYGNAVGIVTTVTDNDSNSPYKGQSWTTSVANTTDISANQSADLAAWCLNLLDETQVTYSSTLSGSTSVTRTQTFTPNTPDRLPDQRHRHGANGEWWALQGDRSVDVRQFRGNVA